MGYEIVPYASELDAQIAQLQLHLGNGDAKQNAANLKWKYSENPFFDETLMYLALCEGRVVGMRAMIGTLWEVDNHTSRYLLPYADDLVVAPEHRNRGIVKLIMDAALGDLARRGFPFAISLSAGPVTYVASLALGWRSAGSLEPVARGESPPSAPRPRSRARALAAGVPWLRRLAGMLLVQRARTVFRNLDRGARSGGGPISVSGSPRPEAMAELIARLPWDGRLRHVRDARYFAWRFRNPGREYRFLFAGGEHLQGYLVLRRAVSDVYDLERVNIVDWEATDDEVRAELLATALRWGRFEQVRAWMASAGDSTRSLLRTHGFEEPSDRVRLRHQGLLVRRIGDDVAPDWHLGSRNLLKISDWDMRMLYSMTG